MCRCATICLLACVHCPNPPPSSAPPNTHTTFPPPSTRLKLPTELGKLDFKAAFKLDQSYSLGGKVAPLLAQHDELCDLLSQLALELQQAVAVERDIDPKVS